MNKQSVLLTRPIKNIPQVDLAHLAEKVAQGDRSAEKEVVLLFSDYLLMFIARKLNEVELHDDIYQETILAVLLKLRAGEILNPQALKSYVLATANHLIFRVINQRNIALAKVTETDVETVSALDETAFDSFVDQDDKRLLYTAIEHLKAGRDRDIMSAILLEHKEKRDVCILLGLTSAQFDRILNRAKVRLIEQMNLAKQQCYS